MVSFESDYTTGAHPAVLQRLLETNREPLPGYGADGYCARAAEKIRAACGAPQADVCFLAGGTQTNAVAASVLLRDHEGAVAAETGHIAVHEAGAIEYTGHKVLTLPQHEGKLDADELARFLAAFYADENHAHMVHPGMVYLSHPTEYGTLYALGELTAIAGICRRYGMRLYLDGARLGCALASPAADMALPDIARLCDAFTIGGTKMGALCGEALVFPRGDMPPHMLASVKRRGALLAKGRLLGVQFDALFTDGLYLAIGRHADETAQRLKELFVRRGYALRLDSPTNQQFVILSAAQAARLKERGVAFSFWEALADGAMVARFATCWSTSQEDLASLEAALC